MWYENEVKRYTNEILEFYYDNNRVNHLSLVQKEDELLDALQIAKKIILPFIEKNVYIVLSPLVQGIQMTEFQYIINQLKEKGKDNLKSDKLPDRKIIENGIQKLLPFTKPDFMIVPIGFFVDMHRWGIPMTDSYHIIKYQDKYPFYHFREERLKIIWSNKFVNLNEIIIGNKEHSLWQYKADEETDERITIKFERGLEGETLLLKTVFKYTPPYSENISIIEFPEELTKLEKK